MNTDVEFTPQAWRAKYQQAYQTTEAHWQLVPASVAADMKITGLWQGKGFELFCIAQQVVTQATPAITPDTFSQLPTSMQRWLIQPVCKQWFARIGSAEPEVTGVAIIDASVFDSQLICQPTSDSEDEEQAYCTWLFHAANSESQPFLNALLPDWPETEVIDQPQLPIVLRFIAGIQPLSAQELQQLHTGALIRQGYLFHPSLIAAECDYLQPNVLPENATLLSRNESDVYIGQTSINLPCIPGDTPWLIYEIAHTIMSATTLQNNMTHGMTEPALNNQLSSCLVNIYRSDHRIQYQFCGQGEIVRFLDSYAVLVSYWCDTPEQDNPNV